MRKFLKNNGLSLVFLLLFILSFIGQVYFGWIEHNNERIADNLPLVSLPGYFSSGHFLQSTFENWESEFLQMALFVWLTIFLFQKGSSESKDPEGKEAVDREPSARRKNVPWPVKKGGIVLALYKHSLTLTLFLIFIISYWLHFYGSWKDENLQHTAKGELPVSQFDYIQESRFWFESFQNWQSEFLSVFAIVLLSVYLRQRGSSQSKPVDAPHDETGT